MRGRCENPPFSLRITEVKTEAYYEKNHMARAISFSPAGIKAL